MDMKIIKANTIYTLYKVTKNQFIFTRSVKIGNHNRLVREVTIINTKTYKTYKYNKLKDRIKRIFDVDLNLK